MAIDVQLRNDLATFSFLAAEPIPVVAAGTIGTVKASLDYDWPGTMKLLLSLLIVCVFAAGGLSQDQNVNSPAGLSKKEFTKLHAQLQPKDQTWKSIPWRTSLLDSQRAAVKQQKPILIWAMDGHPLGCT